MSNVSKPFGFIVHLHARPSLALRCAVFSFVVPVTAFQEADHAIAIASASFKERHNAHVTFVEAAGLTRSKIEAFLARSALTPLPVYFVLERYCDRHLGGSSHWITGIADPWF